MPDHVTNIIVTKTKAQHEALKQLLLNDEGQVDFDLVIPTPELLNMEECPFIHQITEDLACLSVFKNPDEIERIINTLHQYSKKLRIPWENGERLFEPLNVFGLYMNTFEHNRIEHIALTPETYKDRHKRAFDNAEKIEQCYQNIANYGHPYALDWCTEHWGTKWNAYQTSMTEAPKNYHLAFQTAYAAPVKLLDALYKKHKQEFSVYWFNEQVHTMPANELEDDVIEEYETYAQEEHVTWHKDIGLLENHRHFGKIVVKNGYMRETTLNVKHEKALIHTLLNE